MTRIEKIKAQIAVASDEDIVKFVNRHGPIFHCSDCEVYSKEYGSCDGDCMNHCINWLNSPVAEE